MGRVEQSAWVRRVLGVEIPAEPTPDISSSSNSFTAAQAEWTNSRTRVLGTLKGLETAIRHMNDPAGDQAIILVKAIAANLTAMPANRNSVAELRRYLETDPIIDDAELPNGFGIDVRIRAPLLQALDALGNNLPS